MARPLAHNEVMKSTQDIKDHPLPSLWEDLLEESAAHLLEPRADRLAFADPEFLLRRETRSIRFQMEMLKPELAQAEAGIDHTLVVFGSARFPSPEQAQAMHAQAQASGDAVALARADSALLHARWYDAARRFAHLAATHSQAWPEAERAYICTGGGPGIMEAANRGAHEAGQQSVALNIVLPREQQANPYVTPELSFRFHYFALRKMHFMIRAKALVAFPGGFGTLDELFEVLTLVQTRKARPVPILLYGRSFWEKVWNPDALVEAGTISAEDLACFAYVNSPEEAWARICAFYDMPSGLTGAAQA